MFGKNPIRSKVTDPDNLAIEDMFYTIQGEGPYSALPALFIRLSGCNLACHFCDTQFEANAEKAESLLDIMNRVLSFPAMQRKLVVITGGEPLRQNITKLISALLATGTHMVQIETAGTLWQEGMEALVESGKVTIVCSPKTPKINPKIEQYCRHWKYILINDGGSGWDGLPGVGTQVNNQQSFMPIYRSPGRPDDVVWVSPCDQYDPDRNKRNLELAVRVAMTYGYRLNLQIHKIANVP
jgi:7-carboxy-7-deazaguanine synthase